MAALFFLETYCLLRHARPQALGWNVASCNVAITDKLVPGKGTPTRGSRGNTGPPRPPALVCLGKGGGAAGKACRSDPG